MKLVGRNSKKKPVIRIIVPVFRSPFSGLANNRKLTDEELIRAIRFAAAGEYKVAQTYMQLAESIDNKLAAKVLKSVPTKNVSTWESF